VGLNVIAKKWLPLFSEGDDDDDNDVDDYESVTKVYSEKICLFHKPSDTVNSQTV
jgi:hypothetical protein